MNRSLSLARTLADRRRCEQFRPLPLRDSVRRQEVAQTRKARRTVRLQTTMHEETAELLDRLRRIQGTPGKPLPHNEVIERAVRNLASQCGLIEQRGGLPE